MSETRRCPGCGAAMEYRLGEFDCPSCGRRESRPEEKSTGGSVPSAWERSQERVQASIGSAPAAPGLGYSRIGLKPEGESEAARPGYNVEKGAFLVAFLAVQIVVCFLYMAQYAGGEAAMVSLPSLIVSALISTAGAAIVLYLDNSCLKNGCMVLVGLDVIFYITTIVLAVRTQQLGLAGGLIVNTLLFGWFVSILHRDTQLE